MKLYELPKNSPLRVVMKGIENDYKDDAVFFHTDGMYSYCETSDKVPFHLFAGTEMSLVDGRYEIVEEIPSPYYNPEIGDGALIPA